MTEQEILSNKPKFKSEALEKLYDLHLDHKRSKYPNGWTLSWFNPLDIYKAKKPANKVTAMICDFIRLSGGQSERINTGGTMRDNRKVVTDTVGYTRTIGSTQWTKSGVTPGSSDISAIYQGKVLKIEVKIKDKQSEVQKKYQESIERAGGTYWLVHSLEEFYDFFKSFK